MRKSHVPFSKQEYKALNTIIKGKMNITYLKKFLTNFLITSLNLILVKNLDCKGILTNA